SDMRTKLAWTLVLVAASIAAAAPAGGQSIQYRSAAGVEYRSQRDTGAIARAESALAADPRNVELIIQLGLAQSGARQFREAIETFTRGLTIAPNDAVLYRWRGHRYLSVREFDRALDDLTRGYRLDSTNYGIRYHLGIVRFARGDFAGAADAFARAQRRPPQPSWRARPIGCGCRCRGRGGRPRRRRCWTAAPTSAPRRSWRRTRRSRAATSIRRRSWVTMPPCGGSSSSSPGTPR